MKKFLTYLCLGVFLFAGVYASIGMAELPRTYDGTKAPVSVYELQQNPEAYSLEGVDGAAAAIVQENLAETHAINNVTSILYDFRGYDTLGEAFILITAVAGASVILYNGKKKEKEEPKDE